MCASYGIITVFFHKTHLALYGIRITHCSKQSVIMMNTCALNDDTLFVYTDTFFSPGKLSYSKGLTYHIILRFNTAFIKKWSVNIPKLCIRHINDFCNLVRTFAFACADSITVWINYLYAYR